MIDTPLTHKAMRIAYDAHHSQRDKAGIPYIFHPIHLAEQMTDETTTCVALLHGVVEDTPLTLETLAQVFPPAVIRALRLLTHLPDTPYDDYIRALRNDPVASIVKRADLLHNSDDARLALCPISEDEKMRLCQKYLHALAILDSRID